MQNPELYAESNTIDTPIHDTLFIDLISTDLAVKKLGHYAQGRSNAKYTISLNK